MPSRDLIEKFAHENGITIERGALSATIGRFLTTSADNKAREAKIRQYIEAEYPRIAKEFERNKVQSAVLKQETVSSTTAWELFESYVNIVSEVAKETYDDMLKQNAEERQKAQALLDDANEKNAKAQQIYENAKNLKFEDVDQSNYANEAEFEGKKKKYKDAAELAEIAVKNAEARLKDIVDPAPYEGTMDYFGISEKRAKTMLEAQVNALTYHAVRRSQIESTGVTNPAYMEELREAFGGNVSYREASADVQKKMQEVFETKRLMQEKLDSKKGFGGWFWKLFHRSETKAMTGYVNAAAEALRNAGFDDAAATEAIDAMENKGYFYGEYKASGIENTIKEKFAGNEKAYEEMKKAAEQAAKPLQEKAAEQAAKPLQDQFFEINFRPTTKGVDAFREQAQAFNDVARIVKNKQLPEDVMHVFKANSKKIALLQRRFKNQGDNVFVSETNEDIEKALMTKISADTYKPMTFAEVQALAPVKEKMVIELNDNVKSEVSKPVEEPTKEKAPVVKE